MQREPTPEEVAALNAEFSDIVVRGEMETIDATRAEIADGDHLDLRASDVLVRPSELGPSAHADRPPERPAETLKRSGALTPIR